MGTRETYVCIKQPLAAVQSSIFRRMTPIQVCHITDSDLEQDLNAPDDRGSTSGPTDHDRADRARKRAVKRALKAVRASQAQPPQRWMRSSNVGDRGSRILRPLNDSTPPSPTVAGRDLFFNLPTELILMILQRTEIDDHRNLIQSDLLIGRLFDREKDRTIIYKAMLAHQYRLWHAAFGDPKNRKAKEADSFLSAFASIEPAMYATEKAWTFKPRKSVCASFFTQLQENRLGLLDHIRTYRLLDQRLEMDQLRFSHELGLTVGKRAMICLSRLCFNSVVNQEQLRSQPNTRLLGTRLSWDDRGAILDSQEERVKDEVCHFFEQVISTAAGRMFPFPPLAGQRPDIRPGHRTLRQTVSPIVLLGLVATCRRILTSIPVFGLLAGHFSMARFLGRELHQSPPEIPMVRERAGGATVRDEAAWCCDVATDIFNNGASDMDTDMDDCHDFLRKCGFDPAGPVIPQAVLDRMIDTLG